MRKSRLDDYVPNWWAAIEGWAKANGVSEVGLDQLIELIYGAVDECGAKFLGATGGQKGGKARAAKLTPEKRSAQARHAARARWRGHIEL